MGPMLMVQTFNSIYAKRTDMWVPRQTNKQKNTAL